MTHAPSLPRLRRSAGPVAAVVAAGLVGASAAWALAQGHYGALQLRRKDALLIEKSAEIEELLRRRGAVLTEGPELELVARIGRDVAPPRPDDAYVRYRFGVLRSEIPNAFALPDGQIYVHTGLLALLENEAQLAAVLAHEVMHVEGHHSIINARQARKKQGGMVVLSILLGDVGNLINIAFLKAIIGYTRDLEEEADRRAVERMLAAGYDPREMPRVFELLDEDPEGEQLPVKPSWSDHPQNVARAAYTREILDGMTERLAAADEAGGLRVAGEAFGATVAWSAHDSVRRHVDADRPRTALSLARRVAERWPEDPDSHALLGDAYRALDARVATLPESERTRRATKERRRERRKMTREEREERRLGASESVPVLQENRDLAARSYREALDLDPDHPDALRGLGYLLEERGELVEAGRALAHYLRVAPDASDRPIVLQHLESITRRLEAIRTEDSP